MGYLIPGGRIKRFGDSLVPGSDGIVQVPNVKPSIGGSLINTQGRIAKARSATAAAGADISRTSPTFNDPRYSFTTLSIPTDLRTLNGLYRFFDDTDPVVGNALRLHTEFPLSRISMKDHADPVIQAHYEDMWNRISMEKLLFDIALEYWRIGNVFPYGAWNVDDMMWDQFVVLNPDYVTVEGTYLNKKPFIKLQPDEHLKKVVTTGQPKFLYDQLPREIIKYVRMGQEIPLSPQNVFHVSHNKAPYETLGRSIIKRILKSLIYEDRMSMANFAIATRQTIPITVVKIGDPQSGWVPNDEELDEVREMLSAREVDPNFTIVYHWGIDIQFYGASGKIWNLTNEFNRIMKWKLLGLGISEALLTGAGSYASAYAQLEVLRQRYLHFQQTLQTFVYQGIFEPVAKQCGFYKTESTVAGKYYTGNKYGSSDSKQAKITEMIRKHGTEFNNPESKLYINSLLKAQAADDGHVSGLEYPKLDWDLLSLSNDVQYRNFLMNFDRLFPGQRKVSDDTFYAAAKLDKKTEQAKLAREHKQNLEDMLEKGKITKEYSEKFAAEGIPMPGDPKEQQQQGGQPGGPGAPPGQQGTPGAPGGMNLPPGAAPPMGGTGGGNAAGSPAMTPNAPQGAPAFQGAPNSPEASRLRSMQVHERLTASIQDIQKENDEEVTRLRKFNNDAGINIEAIDEELVKSIEKEEQVGSNKDNDE